MCSYICVGTLQVMSRYLFVGNMSKYLFVGIMRRYMCVGIMSRHLCISLFSCFAEFFETCLFAKAI